MTSYTTENEIVAESFSIESVPEGISLGGKRKLNQVLKGIIQECAIIIMLCTINILLFPTQII